MAKTARDIMALIAEKGIKMVDFKMVDINGQFRHVTIPASRFSEATLTEGESLTLTATVAPEDATDKTVTWSSSDKGVATVDNNGKVTAVAAGTAIITAKAGDKEATCVVTVEYPAGIEKSGIRNHKSEIVFDLQGRKVENPTKGIYIVGGKKTVVR